MPTAKTPGLITLDNDQVLRVPKPGIGRAMSAMDSSAVKRAFSLGGLTSDPGSPEDFMSGNIERFGRASVP
jgi:hypothetical protein